MENMLVIGPLPLPLVHGEGAAATRGILVDDRTQGGGHRGAPDRNSTLDCLIQFKNIFFSIHFIDNIS